MILSPNFTLNEFLRSQVATRRGGDLLKEQYQPSQEVIENLQYLVTACLQPVRILLRCPINISSGYRCKALNDLIGGSPTSQHMQGEAADLHLSERFLNDTKYRRWMNVVDSMISERIRRKPRLGVNPDYYLFATMALYLHDLDIDQLIHEYGQDGEPGWVHVSASRSRNRREILIKRQGEAYQRLTVEEALRLGI